MQKLETEFWCHTRIGASHAAYTGRFHKLARLIPHLVTPKNKRIEKYIYGLALRICAMVAAIKPTIIQRVVLKAGMLIDEVIRNGALNKVTEKRRNNRELSRDGNARNDNKRVGYRIVNLLNAIKLTATHGACFECGSTDHYKAACPRSWKQWQPGTWEGFCDGSRGGSPGPKHNDRLKAEIICHEKVVRIPLLNNEKLRVLGEKLEEEVRHSKSPKVKERKLKDIVIIRNFLEFLGHVINGDGQHVDSRKNEAVKSCKANVVADALSRKERFKPKRVQAMNMTIQSSIKDKTLEAQNEASETVNAPT
nr:reverse transcriptase domain-containing protein [Tanacetum cinerariifolium]